MGVLCGTMWLYIEGDSMSKNKNWHVLFIKDERSAFDADTQKFDQLFTKVDKVSDRDEALRLAESTHYDIIISDLSVEPEAVGLLKKIKDAKQTQEIFALVLEKDRDKLYGISDMGINAIELSPEQLDEALDALAELDLSELHKK